MQAHNTRIQYHIFSVDVARELGMVQSVILYHLHFWIDQNRDNEKNFYDGYYWTYNTPEAFAKQLPYLTKDQIRNALKKLIDGGYILKACHNKNGFDRTAWYALTDKYFNLIDGGSNRIKNDTPDLEKVSTQSIPKMEGLIWQNYQMDLAKLPNGFGKITKSIIGITDKEHTDIKQSSFFMPQQVESKKTLVPPTSPQNDFSPESEIDVQAKTKSTLPKSENENPDKQKKPDLPNIQIPNLERKRMTKQEKYVLGIQTYRDLKAECGDKLPLEESEWAEWVEHKVKTQPSKVTETSFKKQLKKAIGLDREYLLNQISKAISASWESPHFDKLSCDKFLNSKNSLLDSQKKTREYQLKHGVSGIAKYDFDDVEEGISEF